jgi:hypothetical protein
MASMNAQRSAARIALICLLAPALLPASAPTIETTVSNRSAGSQAITADTRAIKADFGSLPLAFIPNAGQTDAAVRFQTHALGGTLFFTPDEVVMTLPQHDQRSRAADQRTLVDEAKATAAHPLSSVRLRFDNANPATEVGGGEQLPGVVNYLVGERTQWHTNIPTYAEIFYHQLYPGIDLHYDGAGGHLEGTYTVAPGSNPSQIRWRYDGATNLEIDRTTGDLLIALPQEPPRSAPRTPLIEHAPIAWQVIDGRRIPVEARYVLYNDQATSAIGFMFGSYDAAYPLTIDPTITYSTYIGGSDWESAYDVAVDATGNVYITGQTISAPFPFASNSPQATFGGYDAFILKLNPAGNAIVYSNYVGSSQDDLAISIAVDATGSAYIAGWTNSSDSNYNSCPAPNNSTRNCAFAAKLNPNASLGYFYYLNADFNASTDDTAYGIAVDANGSAYVTGRLKESITHNNTDDVLVEKLAPDGASAIYSVFFGGSGFDEGHQIVIDGSGNAYVTGYTDSTDFQTYPNTALQPNHGGGSDAFVAKLTPDGNNLIYSTYLGGSADDSGWGIAIDDAGDVYVAGATTSSDFPTQAALQPALSGSSDAFVSKLDPAGTASIYSTYLGGTSDDTAFDLVLDTDGNVYVAGQTNSIDFPTVNPTQLGFAGGASDGFVSRVDPQGATLTYSTYLGGSLEDGANAIANDGEGNIFVTGYTSSANFPTKDAVQPAFGGGANDTFITKINIGAGKYTISGQILDAQGRPIAGVSIAAGSAGNAVTGADGAYSFTNLSAASYTLVPSKLGYNFTPPADDVTVPPDVTGHNFTATAITSGRTFLPLMVRSAPPACDPYEPNDARGVNPSGPLVSAQDYQARICTGDEEDNYFFTTTTNNPVRITLALPGTLAGNTVLLLYDAQTDMRQYLQNCGGLPISGASYAGTCKIPRPGRYVIRIYNERQKDNLNFYTLRVTYQ